MGQLWVNYVWSVHWVSWGTINYLSQHLREPHRCDATTGQPQHVQHQLSLAAELEAQAICQNGPRTHKQRQIAGRCACVRQQLLDLPDDRSALAAQPRREDSTCAPVRVAAPVEPHLQVL